MVKTDRNDMTQTGRTAAATGSRVTEMRSSVDALKREVAKAIVGHEGIIHGVLTCLFCGGHALLEGVPGLGKTYLIKSLGEAMDLKSSRIQFTPDLMPADILGTNILVQSENDRRLIRFQHGPVFANIVLADEINRATPKTQSALLEAMQEQAVTVGGRTFPLEDPFVVLATQNPIEMEGTYPLPEAQLDRFFFKLTVAYPSQAEINEILNKTTKGNLPRLEKVVNAEFVREMKRLVKEVPIAEHVQQYAIRLTMATQSGNPHSTDLSRQYVRYGSSPRGAQSLVLAAKVSALLEGRYNVSFEDIRGVARPSLRHRIILNFEGEAADITPEDIIADLIEKTPEVVENT